MATRLNKMIKIYGHFDGQFGVGEAARRLSTLVGARNIIEQQEIGAFEIFANSASRLDAKSHSPTLNIFAVNPDETALAYSIARSYKNKNATNIGFWAWELPNFPPVFESSLNLLDRIWAVSSFVSESINRSAKSCQASAIQLPVPIFPMNRIEKKLQNTGSNKHFRVLSVFDFNSDFSRKNVLGNIGAYLKAFPNEGNERLILKSINYRSHPNAFQEMVKATKNRSDIILMNDSASKQELSELLYSADVFLSLHRSEGYGINLIDSMARGTVVISTAYSGNLDFQTQENSILVPYNLVPVTEYGGWKVNSHWAQPDTDVAADALIQIRTNHEYQREIAMKAAQEIQAKYNLDSSLLAFEKNFSGIGI